MRLGTLVGDFGYSARRAAELAIRDAIVKLIFFISAMIFAMLGLTFLLVSLYLYIQNFMLPWQSALVTAGFTFLTAFFILMLSRTRRPRAAPAPRYRAAPPPSTPPPDTPATDPYASATQFGRAAGASLRQAGLRPTDMALVALVAGVAAGVTTASVNRRRH